jgi:hypothetical protein
VIVPGILECLLHLLYCQRSKSVAHLGAVYGDLGDPLRLVVLDVLELSGLLPSNISHD